jgi:hypothetical protein
VRLERTPPLWRPGRLAWWAAWHWVERRFSFLTWKVGEAKVYTSGRYTNAERWVDYEALLLWREGICYIAKKTLTLSEA